MLFEARRGDSFSKWYKTLPNTWIDVSKFMGNNERDFVSEICRYGKGTGAALGERQDYARFVGTSRRSF